MYIYIYESVCVCVCERESVGVCQDVLGSSEGHLCENQSCVVLFYILKLFKDFIIEILYYLLCTFVHRALS